MQETGNILEKGSTFQYDDSIIQQYGWSICALSPLFFSMCYSQLRSSFCDVAVFFIYITALINFQNYII